MVHLYTKLLITHTLGRWYKVYSPASKFQCSQRQNDFPSKLPNSINPIEIFSKIIKIYKFQNILSVILNSLYDQLSLKLKVTIQYSKFHLPLTIFNYDSATNSTLLSSFPQFRFVFVENWC
jgi:hypothetical protein